MLKSNKHSKLLLGGRTAYRSHHLLGAVKLIALMLTLIQFGPGAIQAAAYDLSSDFSTVSNPTGPWSYGAMTNLGGSFSLFTATQTSTSGNGVQENYWLLTPQTEPFIMHNGTTSTIVEDGGQGVYPPGAVLLYPGIGDAYLFGVVRFTVPQGGAGSYLLNATAHTQLTGSLSGDIDFHVSDDGTQLFGQFISPSSGTSYTTTLNLAVGDTIDFAVGRGLDGDGNQSGGLITASLAPVPEPCPFALDVFGVVGMLIIRRRK